MSGSLALGPGYFLDLLSGELVIPDGSKIPQSSVSPETIIEIYERRVAAWLLEPARVLLAAEADALRYGVLHLLAAYPEMWWKVSGQYGQRGTRGDGEEYADACASIFASMERPISEWKDFYRSVRCALFHQGFVGSFSLPDRFNPGTWARPAPAFIVNSTMSGTTTVNHVTGSLSGSVGAPLATAISTIISSSAPAQCITFATIPAARPAMFVEPRMLLEAIERHHKGYVGSLTPGSSARTDFLRETKPWLGF